MHLHNKLINAVITGDVDQLENLLSELRSSIDSGVTNQEETKHENFQVVKDPSGNTLLHFGVLRCIWHGNYQRRVQPPINLDDTDSPTNNMVAINCKIFEILLSDPDQNQKLLSIKNNDDQTPLHLFHGELSTKLVQSDNLTKMSLKRSSLVDHKYYIDTFFNLAFPQNSSIHKSCEGETDEENVGVSAIDVVDNFGNSALNFAVKSKCTRCIQRLLKSGASFNINSNNSWAPFVTPLIFHQDPWASTILESRLNKNMAFDDFCEQNYEVEDEEEFADDESRFAVSYNFCDIVPRTAVDSSKPEREMEFIESFLSADGSVKKQILGHPLVASFVFMKWELIRWMFVWSFVLHIGLATLFTAYSMTVYLWRCPYSNSTVKNMTLNHLPLKCDQGLGSFEFSIILLFVIAILTLLELAKIFQNIARYRKEWQNIFQIIMIISMWLSAWPLRWTRCHCLEKWQYSASAYGIFHVWSTLLINVGRFPKLGIYVEMFGKVLENFGYMMIAYIFLLIAFSVSFCVVFPDYPPFETIPRATLKVITMMSGEVDYGDFFYGDHKGQETRNFIYKEDSSDLIHPITAHILYGAFVILVTILLSNLLIGLAVDDIKALAQNAEFTKTTREIANIAYVESLIFWTMLPNIDLVQKLRRSIVVARFPNNDNIRDTNITRKKSSKLHRIRRNIRQVLTAFCFCRSRKELDYERKSSYRNVPTQKYAFQVSLDDCKAPRGFPENTYFKSVELIKKRKIAKLNTNSD